MQAIDLSKFGGGWTNPALILSWQQDPTTPTVVHLTLAGGTVLARTFADAATAAKWCHDFVPEWNKATTQVVQSPGFIR